MSCVGGAGLNIYLGFSQAGFEYTLYLNDEATTHWELASAMQINDIFGHEAAVELVDHALDTAARRKEIA